MQIPHAAADETLDETANGAVRARAYSVFMFSIEGGRGSGAEDAMGRIAPRTLAPRFFEGS